MQNLNPRLVAIPRRAILMSDSGELQVSIEATGTIRATAVSSVSPVVDIEELEELIAEAMAQVRRSRRELLGIDDAQVPPIVDSDPQAAWLWNEYIRRLQIGKSEISSRADRLSGSVGVEVYGDGDVVLDVQHDALRNTTQFLQMIGEAVTEAAAGLDDALRAFHQELDSTMQGLKKELST